MRQPCEFVGEANTVAGVVVPCRKKAVVVMRLRGVEALLMGKRKVCDEHMKLLLSGEVKSAGRDWQIDRFLRE